MPTAKSNAKNQRLGVEPLFRCWVEVLARNSGVVRILPVNGIVKIPLIATTGDPQRLSQEVLQLRDGAVILEARNLEDLATQIRRRYPNSDYRRSFHQERDLAAEECRSGAVDRLITLIAEQVAQSMLEEQEGVQPAPPLKAKTPPKRRR